ncbi:MAG: HEAT repeat domain-containing protein, partial [Planctomycetes bacterium]|nr:HEAT repeat domain-containing protein [Planctomycetota bacterium]
HDFSFDFYEVMTQSDWDRLLGHVRGISEWDPSQNFLIYGVAMSGKPEVTSALMGLCDKPARTKVFEDLAWVASFKGINEAVVAALQPHLQLDADPMTRRIAAFVLARTNAPEAEGELLKLFEDKDPDIVSEAIIGLAGKDHAQVRSKVFDEVNKRLAPTIVELNETELGRVIRERQLYYARHEWHSGESFRLMAAGFYLVRSKNQQDHNWMEARLKRIADWGVRHFIEAKLHSQFQNYDHPW